MNNEFETELAERIIAARIDECEFHYSPYAAGRWSMTFRIDGEYHEVHAATVQECVEQVENAFGKVTMTELLEELGRISDKAEALGFPINITFTEEMGITVLDAADNVVIYYLPGFDLDTAAESLIEVLSEYGYNVTV
jgi:hypothetical protein